ncbi:GNAT family N-acetyltransferase [Elstera cyanobacteriorum]|uniref:N-acetyltransferase domain-containing protein n=1 Tax=Elstera cyanobacteriorum TaxID=2022747 RepID=A0A255XPK7_9PROT|nr:GNAT family N-acetyltransferase [Elstera cyanobacteriorum]OYQ18908.1 hypothetical protein CHR90_11720 [Elstera cyanobacteriorum]
MLRRAKSVDIPFMVKGYEIGLRDGNFSESKMQINAFFANTTTHKNVHSYIYEHNGTVSGYAILRKKDDIRHEIMMMFVDPSVQGQGVGRKFLTAMLTGPLKDSPVLCSTTQPASARMMRLLKSLGFERKIEAADGVYWEKLNTPGATSALPAKPKGGASSPAQPTGQAPAPRLLLPVPMLEEAAETGDDLVQATKVTPQLPKSYAPKPVSNTPPPVLEGEAVVIPSTDPEAPTPQTISASPPSAPPEEPAALPASPSDTPPSALEESQSPPPAPPAQALISTEPAELAVDSPEATPVAEIQPPGSASLPQPPADFSAKARELGYVSKQERARQLARELFQTLRSQDEPATPEQLPAPIDTPPSTEAPDTEEIPLLATLNVVREKMGSLPGVSLPPLDRYRLMELNKKDLENMNVVELAALSAQLVKLAKDQLAEIDRLKVATQKRR